MAALSYYTNWDTSFQPEMNSDTTNFLAQQETTEVFPDQFFNYDGFECFPDSYCNDIDNLYDPNDVLFYSENYNTNMFPQQLPYNNNLPTPLPDVYTLNTPFVHFEPFQTLKRQKVVCDNYEPFYFDDQLMINPSLITLDGVLQDNCLPEFVLPEYFVAAPPVYSGGSYEAVTKPPPPALSGGGSLSAQSAAARQRRRKITEKTHELGKLIPGGQKMNTAEMLQSAYKYIKFLQAEVGILELMGSFDHQENEDSKLHGFLVSPLIQEKLYSSEKCLVPEKFVRSLATDHDIKFESKTELLKEIN